MRCAKGASQCTAARFHRAGNAARLSVDITNHKSSGESMNTGSRPDSRHGALALCVAMLAVGAVPVHAQSVASDTLQEVVVTAERRVENLQSVPISATVLNADALAEAGVNNVSNLQQVAPGVAINTYNRSTFINIRGVGIAQSAPTSSPGVAFYIDGALVPHEQIIGQSFYDLASVEVLRGPQGTLTGQNSTGGAVYVRTPDPVLGKWAGSIDQTLGNYRWFRTIGALNVPLGSSVALRLAGVLDTRDSFSRNLANNGVTPGNVNFKGYRAALTWQASDVFHVNLRYENYLNNTDHNAIKNRLDAITSDPFTIEEDAVSRFYQSGYRSSAELLYDVRPTVRLRWLSSYQYGYTEDISDGDRTMTAKPRPPTSNVGRLGYAKTTINTTTHELNLLSTGDAPLNWIAGAFYMNDKVPVILLRYNNSTVVRDTAPTSTTIAIAENTSKSVFGQAGYKFTPQWQLSVGARYSQDEQDYNRIVSPGGTGLGVQKSSKTTGRLALNWTPFDNLLAYASYSRGYKAGGVNLGIADPNYLPEENNVTELGIKDTLLDGHLRINADVFHSDYKNIQLASLAGTPPAPVTQNAAAGVANGAELEVQAAVGGFAASLGLGWLDATFAQATTLQNAVSGTNQLVPKGTALPFSPKLTGSAGVQYKFVTGLGTLTPRLQYSYAGEQWATPFQSFVTDVPSHGVADFRLTWEPSEQWRLEAAVTNLTDKVYIASQIQNSSTADGGIIYGAPRQYTVRVSRKFN
jgi:iron complex outermembrane receptor protein